MQQSDLFRLTSVTETVKNMRWVYRLLSEREWSGRHAVPVTPPVDSLYLLKSSLDGAFDADGRQTGAVMARISGNFAGLSALLLSCGWEAQPAENTSNLYRLCAVRTDPHY